MAYDKVVYKALRSLKVPYKIALALADAASPVVGGSGESAVSLVGNQTIAGDKTFKKPPKIEHGSKAFLEAAEIQESYGAHQGDGSLVSESSGDDLMFAWPFIEFEVGDTIKVELKITAFAHPGNTAPYVSLWSATNPPAPFQYDTQVGETVVGSTLQDAEQTVTIEIEDFPTERFIVYIDGQEVICQLNSAKVWINNELYVYDPQAVTFPVLTGVREVVSIKAGDPLLDVNGALTVTHAHVGKIIVCQEVDYIYLPFSDELPIGATVDIVCVDQPGDLFIRPGIDARAGYPDADGQLLGKGSTVGGDGVPILFGNIKLDEAGARVTATKVPSVVGTDEDAWGPDAWHLRGDYVLPDA